MRWSGEQFQGFVHLCQVQKMRPGAANKICSILRPTLRAILRQQGRYRTPALRTLTSFERCAQ